MHKFIEKIIKRRTLLILGFILVAGIFFRTYNFKEWLYFAKDQARDAFIVESVLKGDSPLPVLGPKMGNSGYKLGPLFYYIKMASGKIIGIGPDKMAYPELFFSILTIPLFYFFLKRYFYTNLSLALTGLYAISFFAVRYSRFAWQLNLIPFFVLLFILSLSEFLYAKEKTGWRWIVLLGLTLGTVVQLHAILILLSLPIIFLAFVYILIKNKQALKKCLVILLLAIILNTGQIIGELKNNYLNSKKFISSFTDKSANNQGNLGRNLKLSVACYVQSNGYILSSLGEKDNCNLANPKSYSTNRQAELAGVIVSFSFVAIGFVLLIRYFWQEKDERKKIFLGIIILYSALFFLIMTPAIDGATLRYYIHIFFLPYLFLGFIVQYLSSKFTKKYIWIALIIFVFLAMANIFSIRAVVRELSAKNKSRGDSIILGEIEPIADYVVSEAYPQKKAVLTGRYAPSYFWPLMYLSQKKGLLLTQLPRGEKNRAGAIVFDINPSDSKRAIGGNRATVFGNIIVSQNQN
jgi:4-amino-4-deoxy-L-arabinose transferase-like glycosyltransferase